MVETKQLFIQAIAPGCFQYFFIGGVLNRGDFNYAVLYRFFNRAVKLIDLLHSTR